MLFHDVDLSLLVAGDRMEDAERPLASTLSLVQPSPPPPSTSPSCALRIVDSSLSLSVMVPNPVAIYLQDLDSLEAVMSGVSTIPDRQCPDPLLRLQLPHV